MMESSLVLEPSSTSDLSVSDDQPVNILIVFIVVMEFLLLVFVSIFAYFLRNSDIFPVREVNFTCNDPGISLKMGQDTYSTFTYHADIPYEVMLSVSFCLPPIMIITGELAHWAFAGQQQKTVLVLCKFCNIPQVIRRMIRFIGSYLFGILVTMIITDVTKTFVGRLRPIFLEVCAPNTTECWTGQWLDQGSCMETDQALLRDSRLSFPSLHASITAFAAIYSAVYLESVMRPRSARILRTFFVLTLPVLSFLCCLARYGLHYSHWSDLLVGFLLGLILALYISVVILQRFREKINTNALHLQLQQFLLSQRAKDLRELYKEQQVDQQGPYLAFASGPTYNLSIPRPHVNAAMENDEPNDVVTSQNSHRPEPPGRHTRAKDTFQRDLHRTLVEQARHSPADTLDYSS